MTYRIFECKNLYYVNDYISKFIKSVKYRLKYYTLTISSAIFSKKNHQFMREADICIRPILLSTFAVETLYHDI